MTYTFTYEKYAQALYPALLDDAFYMAMKDSVKGNHLSSSEAMVRYMDYSMVEAEKFGELVLPEKGHYGAAIWSKPLGTQDQTLKSKEKASFLYQFMGTKSLEIYQSIVDFMSLKAEDVVGKDFWYLSIVGLDPEFQNKGLGRSLLTPVLKKTDARNVPTFLETFTPKNISFYNRIGYKTAASFFEPTAKAAYHIMIREPGSAF